MNKENDNKQLSQGLTSLDVLMAMPPVEGNELDVLLGEFHGAVNEMAKNETNLDNMCGLLQDINREYLPGVYSKVEEANVLANVVAAYYAPLIHGFSVMILDNISVGNIPQVVLLPPRDTIPIETSLKEMAKIKQIPITVLKPPVNRNITGIANNQLNHVAKKDPLFDQLMKQEIQENVSNGLVEAEFGIYSTTSLVIAKWLQNEIPGFEFTPLKFYGLGPNLSWVHALLSDGKEWVSEQAEYQGLVNPKTVADLMVLIDTLEELGMQNMYESVEKLELSISGKVVPVIVPVDETSHEIAIATNKAVKETASHYQEVDTHFIQGLLGLVPEMVEMAKIGYPTMLTGPIPPMSAPKEHFQGIRDSQVFHYPKLILK